MHKINALAPLQAICIGGTPVALPPVYITCVADANAARRLESLGTYDMM